MQNIIPVHGGTDSATPPEHDFSSNANGLGSNPFVLDALHVADPRCYPDPNYTLLYEELSVFHVKPAEYFAVGAGASELILRLMHWQKVAGSVLTLSPTFGEYARAAHVTNLPVVEASNETDFIVHLPSSRIAFLCLPNNPTGQHYSNEFLKEVERIANISNTIVVIDLAYRDLSQYKPEIPDTFWQLHSPNKAHGMTGVRAGYLIAPVELLMFRHVAPTWVLSVHGESFLRSIISDDSQQWLSKAVPVLWQRRDELIETIHTFGFEQRWSDANFGLIRVGNAPKATKLLRYKGIGVRDCSSFGLPEWIRISVQNPAANNALVSELKQLKL